MSWRPQPMPTLPPGRYTFTGRISMVDTTPSGAFSGGYGLSAWMAYNEQHSGQKCRENRLPETRTGSGLDGDNPPIPADLTLPARPNSEKG